MRHGDRVVVHVDHAGSGADRLRHLVHVALGGDARAEVDELPYPGLDQEAHSPAEEVPVGPGQGAHLGVDRRERGQRLAVYGEIVFTAQHRVVHSGDTRLAGIDPLRQTSTTRHHNSPSPEDP